MSFFSGATAHGWRWRRPRSSVTVLVLVLLLQLRPHTHRPAGESPTFIGEASASHFQIALRRRKGTLSRRASPSSLVCVSSEGRSLEEVLRSTLPLDSAAPLDGSDEEAGTYTITSKAPVLVGATKELGPPPFLAELQEGDTVEVVELARVAGDRLRGRISEPEGWISLRNTATGFRWARPQAALQSFDEALAEALEQLSEQVPSDGADIEAELSREARGRVRADLLYLSAVRRQAESGLPSLPSFEASEKTWAMSGDGLEQWREMAGTRARDVPLTAISGQLRRELLRAVTGGDDHSKDLLDAYAQQFTQFQGPFAPFFERFRKAQQEFLQSIGGSCGLPTAKGTALEDLKAPSAGRWTQADLQQWLQVFAQISANTRINKADDYFGDALFGICLRRLSRRYQLDLMLASAQEPGAPASTPAVAAERFKSYVEMVAKPSSEDGILDEVLALSSTTVAAVRRQVEALFGSGLRDELQRPLDAANAAIKEFGADSEMPPIEKHASLMLDAANRGELRMLSTSVEAKERIRWDALVFGAFLQEAEDALLSSEE